MQVCKSQHYQNHTRIYPHLELNQYAQRTEPAVDILQVKDGKWGISLSNTFEDMSPAEARQLASALVIAAKMVEMGKC